MAHGAWVAWARAVRSGRGRRWVPGHAYRACERGASTGWGDGAEKATQGFEASGALRTFYAAEKVTAAAAR